MKYYMNSMLLCCVCIGLVDDDVVSGFAIQQQQHRIALRNIPIRSSQQLHSIGTTSIRLSGSKETFPSLIHDVFQSNDDTTRVTANARKAYTLSLDMSQATPPSLPWTQFMDQTTFFARTAITWWALTCSFAVLLTILPMTAHGDDRMMGASSAANSKLTTGGASTLQSGRTISITRGVNLDKSDFHGQNLKGVAFQQSVVRDADFSNTNLVGASFFDATLDGSNFESSDMTLSNVEMAQFNRANLKNAVLREVYVSGATLFEGIKSIENTDWSETYLRADQKKYLCNHPTAKGTNPTTGVDTRESLMCPT